MIAELTLVLQLVTVHPIIFEGHLGHRPAIVHYSGTHFFVVYIEKHPWGKIIHEIKEVDATTFEETTLYISEACQS